MSGPPRPPSEAWDLEGPGLPYSLSRCAGQGCRSCKITKTLTDVRLTKAFRSNARGGGGRPD